MDLARQMPLGVERETLGSDSSIEGASFDYGYQRNQNR